jgi:hypothetical protein
VEPKNVLVLKALSLPQLFAPCIAVIDQFGGASLAHSHSCCGGSA